MAIGVTQYLRQMAEIRIKFVDIFSHRDRPEFVLFNSTRYHSIANIFYDTVRLVSWGDSLATTLFREVTQLHPSAARDGQCEIGANSDCNLAGFDYHENTSCH